MIFSIGHSTHEPDEFVRLVRGIDVIVDVRSHPTSRWPQWRLEQMQMWLPRTGFSVEWIQGLGGWDTQHYPEYHEEMASVGVDLAAYSRGVFPKQRIGRDRPIPRRPDPLAARGWSYDTERPIWINQGLYDYSWYTTTPEFQHGLQALIDKYEGPGKPNAAILCCEALWWKCHRSMIADVLVWLGLDCRHLPSRLPVRETTPRWKYHSDAIGNRLERYDQRIRESWLPLRQAA